MDALFQNIGFTVDHFQKQSIGLFCPLYNASFHDLRRLCIIASRNFPDAHQACLSKQVLARWTVANICGA
jgi:hypothetical protein